ncbi:uncharacterized protein LOC135144560 [Zophobas morio]|uniref:uncharacterized protein LOC135144560 n=1 Tax=Zophobas morio TaxID=2755281 RepID=UPI003082C906
MDNPLDFNTVVSEIEERSFPQPKKIIRVGMPKPSVVRPLKIVYENDDIAKDRDYNNSIRKEFKDKVAQGNTNVMLRYKNNMPYIVEKKYFSGYSSKKVISFCYQNAGGISKYPYWFNKELKELCRLKTTAHCTFKNTGKLDDYLYFKTLRDRCNELIEKVYAEYISNVNRSMVSNPKLLWKFINNKKHGESNIPNEMNFGHQCVKGGEEIANAFAQYFASVYVKDDSNKFVCDFKSSYDVNDMGLKICLSDIFDEISKLKSSCSPGPDGIPSILIKNCKFALCSPLLLLFETPLRDVEHYRGVCCQSAIPKLLDSIVTRQLQWASSSVISSKQHGFVSNRSTLSNLLEYRSFLNEALVNHLQVDSVYTDFAKAFDRVNHKLLLLKLDKLGFKDNTIKWLASFLSGRCQQVRIDNFISSSFSVPSGVPQGTHCGPVLFLSLCKVLTITTYKNYMPNIQNEISSDPKKFWSYIHNKKGSSRIPGLMFYQNSELFNPVDIVNDFGTFFDSVFTVSNPNLNFSFTGPDLPSLTVAIPQISEDEILQLRVGGNDGVPFNLQQIGPLVKEESKSA